MLGEDFAVDDTDSRLNLAVEIFDSTVDGEASVKGDCARGVVECERCSSKSISRGVIGLGIPGTYPGMVRAGIGEARRSLNSSWIVLSMEIASKTVELSEAWLWRCKRGRSAAMSLHQRKN